MKFKFSLKDKEASFDADIEGLVEKRLDYKSKNPERKTRYQIKQEEKRKNAEMEHKHFVQGMIMMGALLVFVLIICFIGSIWWE